MTDRQRKVLAALLAREAECAEWENKSLTCNEIAYALGFRTGSDRLAHNGRQMAPANRVIGSVKGLERRGLVQFAMRRDGLSGTAYRLTDDGRTEALRDA